MAIFEFMDELGFDRTSLSEVCLGPVFSSSCLLHAFSENVGDLLDLDLLKVVVVKSRASGFLSSYG